MNFTRFEAHFLGFLPISIIDFKTITYQPSNGFDEVNVYCAFNILAQNRFLLGGSFAILDRSKLVDELKDALSLFQN